MPAVDHASSGTLGAVTSLPISLTHLEQQQQQQQQQLPQPTQQSPAPLFAPMVCLVIMRQVMLTYTACRCLVWVVTWVRRPQFAASSL